MYPAVFLDRDGVLNLAYTVNGKPFPPSNLEELILIDGVIDSVKKLKNSGLKVIVITNQPDIRNGKTTFNLVNKIHNEISKLAGLEHFYVCHHAEEDQCECRKPKPGLLTQAARELNLNLTKSFLVGDRWRDIHAGQAVGCKNYFINYNYDEPLPQPPYTEVISLSAAVELILGDHHG